MVEATTAPAALAPAAPAAPGLVPELLDAQQAADLLGVSLRGFRNLDDEGRIPGAAFRAGRVVRWSKTELRAWALAGCPNRSAWQLSRESAIRKFGPAIGGAA